MSEPTSQHAFATTHWSLVLAASGDGASHDTRSFQALETLCRAYWFPIYAFVRSRRNSPEDAKDLTQAFFARVVERRDFAKADPDKGRFRSYLLGAVKHFLANEKARAQAKKRGGEFRLVELDGLAPEERYALEAEALAPEARFDREWARETTNRALAKLRLEYCELGKEEQFESLKGCLVGVGSERGEIAAKLGISEGALKVAVHRLRKRYREMLKQEVSLTLAQPGDLDSEMHYLLTALLTE